MTDYKVDRERWSQMSILEQMGNIYSEVGRSFKAKRSGKVDNQNLAATRAIDLFDATVETLIEKKSIRATEVLRAKDQYLISLHGKPFNEKDASSLEKYFLEFAVAARLSK
ncbi:MAG TPA: hypothetical protein VMR18_00100 [Candidatus Saccharimonadales bacterium]|nr:hypothetical protein [Candidatus Saccharimonadales bacterium]